MKLIVGLGNPDAKYQNTRHNAGFMVIDAYCKAKSIDMKMKPAFKGLFFQSRDFILLKPTTYMNLSGESVQAVASFYKIRPEDILVISDDFNLPFSKLRLRSKGSAGGHNGLKSIIQSIGSDSFNRIRVGLGSPEHDTIDFVLNKFNREQLETFESKIYPSTSGAIDMFIEGKSFDLIMNKYNTEAK